MKTIIVATDFSSTSQNAALYASHLAVQLNAHIHLIHTFDLPINYAESPLPVLSIEDIRLNSMDSLKLQADHLREKFPNVSISFEALAGNAFNCIKDKVEELKPILLVVGISNLSTNSFLWRNIAIQSLRFMPCAVLGVPLHAQWQPISNICFSADYHSEVQQFPFNSIINWVQLTKAQLHIVHVSKSAEKHSPDELFKQKLSTVFPNYQTIESPNLGAGVKRYLTENSIDWLMVIPKRYDFFREIFQKSRTEILSHISNVPILALH